MTRIVEVAEKKQIGMIIMGSHGRTGLAHLLVGSKVQRGGTTVTRPGNCRQKPPGISKYLQSGTGIKEISNEIDRFSS